MADAPTDDKPTPKTEDKPPDPDAGAKKALDEERKARREAEKSASDLRAKLKEFEDRDKSETQKLADKVTAAEQRAVEAETRALRAEVAAEKGLKPGLVKRLTGATREELEADAEELLSTFTLDGDKKPPGKPAEDLKGGGDPTQEPATDIRKVVADIPRGI